ncbi:FMN-binding negative transcriptional regulator [Phenylobacterium sp.]|uniref:FMN-binding negative transcriptional regulator n=1 Tax=Phenylobacterium sp. TaxID=1871053 RepID=UPI002DEA3F33|nr:FMN-binding negative transcriptional regulator [Phenylobacterium sp.]
MHPAGHFHEADEARLLAELAAHPFVTLVAAPQDRLLIAHAPVVVRRLPSGLALDFHLSRSNALSGFLAGGFRAVMVSLAAEAYVSPDWYEGDDQVPSWNYITVEAEGPVAVLDDEGLVALLDELAAQEEARLAPKPAWTRHKMSPDRFETMTRAIVGGRLTVERLEGTTKLSQNKSAADQAGVAAALGDHPIARRMAAAIRPRS